MAFYFFSKSKRAHETTNFPADDGVFAVKNKSLPQELDGKTLIGKFNGWLTAFYGFEQEVFPMEIAVHGLAARFFSND